MIDCVRALNIDVGGHLMLKNELEEFITINSSARTMLRAVFGEVCTRACAREHERAACCVCRNAGWSSALLRKQVVSEAEAFD